MKFVIVILASLVLAGCTVPPTSPDVREKTPTATPTHVIYHAF